MSGHCRIRMATGKLATILALLLVFLAISEAWFIQKDQTVEAREEPIEEVAKDEYWCIPWIFNPGKIIN